MTIIRSIVYEKRSAASRGRPRHFEPYSVARGTYRSRDRRECRLLSTLLSLDTVAPFDDDAVWDLLSSTRPT